MEETTLTDRTDLSIEVQVFVEDDSKALEAVRQARSRYCNIYRDDITKRLDSVDRAEKS